MELMKQKQYSPMTVADMAVSLFTAEHGYLDDIELEKIGAFEEALMSYMNSDKKSLKDKINETDDYNDDIEKELHEAIEDFKKNHTW